MNPKIRRDVHIGIDIFSEAGTNIKTPLNAKIIILENNASKYDYGPTVVLEHLISKEIKFYTLYGHLSRKCLKTLKIGQSLKKDQTLIDKSLMIIGTTRDGK